MATLASYLTETGTSMFEMREQRFRQMITPESVRDFQQKLRAVARDALGSYVLSLAKDSTPPQIISAGELQADGIIIEKFLYEVFPSFWAPAVLYRPARDMGPCPALIMPVGHW